MGVVLQLLGGFQVKIDDQPINTRNTSRLQALLAYLALHRDQAVPRAQVAFNLWPDSSEAHSLANLRKLIHQLRRALPGKANPLEETNSRYIQLKKAEGVEADLLSFQSALVQSRQSQLAGQAGMEGAALREAVNIYRGDLLPDCYDEWIIPERDHLRQQYIQAIDRLISLNEQSQDFRDAIQYSLLLLRADPLREETYRTQMQLYARMGDRAAALHVFHTCAETLSAQLGVEPDDATRQIYESLVEKTAAPVMPLAYPLIARHCEWDALVASWKTAQARGVRVHVLVGEAGIGKTRLAGDFLQWAGQQGAAIGKTTCYEGDRENSFGSLSALLHTRPLDRLTPQCRRETARLIPELLAPGEPAPTAITVNWQRTVFLDALSEAVLGDEHQPPLILFLDDIQWCDRETLDWLRRLIHTHPNARLLVLATLREGEIDHITELNHLLLHLRQRMLVSETALPRLDATQTLALAKSICGAELFPARIYEESEGVPLFIVEIARQGMDDVQSEATASAEITPKVRATLEGRLEHLSFQARALAQAAAVLGREFNLSLISTVSGIAEIDAMMALDELWQRRIARETTGGNYYFSHGRLRDAALATLSPVRLRWLHLQSARALENTEEDFTLVASHFADAREPARAAEAFGKAARHALGLFALEEARDLVTRALALEPKKSYPLHELHGDTLSMMGRLSSASEAYGQALVACHASDWKAQTRLYRKILDNTNRLDYDKARNAYQQGMAILLRDPKRDAAYWSEWLELQLSWLRANYWKLNSSEVGRLISITAGPLEEFGTPLQKIQYRTGNLLHHLVTHQFSATSEQVAMARQTADAARDLKSPFLHADYLSSVGFIAFFAEQFEDCVDAYSQSIEISEPLGFLNILERAFTYLSLAYRRLHEPQKAGSILERLSGVLEKTLSHSYMMMVSAQRAWLAMEDERCGEWAAAAVAGWAEDEVTYPVQWPARMVLMALRVRQGAFDLAAEQAREMIAPDQQKLVPEMEAAIQIALAAKPGDAQESWQKTISTAKKVGYL